MDNYTLKFSFFASLVAVGSNFAKAPNAFPYTDPENTGGWVYNTEVSDEFEGDKLDEDRWFIVGKFVDGEPTYVHPDKPKKWVWKGRAPSQFSGNNHRLEDGMLKLEARWEPDFPFSDEIRKPVFGDALPYENITTSCLIQRPDFLYGYIEIKSKAADGPVTSAFWSMGEKLEVDFFEQYGDGRGNKNHLDSQLWWSIRDWDKLKGKPSYTERKKLGFRVADDFHIYGIDWSAEGIKYYIDGELFTSVTAEEASAWARENREVDEDYNGYVATRPLNIWLDMEIFPWHHIPTSKEDLELNSPESEKADGRIDFEIEYVRVWQKATASEPALFTEVDDVIALEEASRRKWDSALVADLDQNGWMDFVLTEHGKAASIRWNDNGIFSEPQQLVGGDTHGVAAGDIDQNGIMDLVVYPGGGGGTKPSNPVVFEIGKDRKITGGEEYGYFTRSRGRAAKLIDADKDGSLDLALSAFPTNPQKKTGANQLYDNVGSREFEFSSLLPKAQWMGFRLLTTDFNSDGDMDCIFYGGKNTVAAQGDEGLSFTDVSKNVLGGLGKTSFVTSLAEIDFDNDGDFDLFVTRGEHSFKEKVYYDAETQCFAYYIFASFTKDIPYQYDLKIDGNFEMVNLQTAYPDFDAFIGAGRRKLEYDDRHAGKNFVLTPEEAMGWPEDVSENGLHIGYLGDGMWRIGGETKSSTSGTVLGVISASAEPTSHERLQAKLFENRNGVFVDVTQQLGIAIDEQTTSAVAGDFDNDGWTDLFVLSDGDPSKEVEQYLLMNQQGKSFSTVKDHGIISKDLGSYGGAAEMVDHDKDGDLDIIYCTERGRWHFLENNTDHKGTNNYIVVDVGNSPSGNATAQGAVLTLQAGGNTYKRVVGSNASWFSHSFNQHLHVGLGSIDQVDSASVEWSNGETKKFTIDKLNQFVEVGQ